MESAHGATSLAMASALPPVSKEQAFLETYFQCLSKFAFDKARELSEKERENSKSQASTAWGVLVNSLVNLAIAEKAYASLLFLGQNLAHKIFGRKESLRTSYGYLLTDLRRIDEGGHSTVAESPTQSSEDRYLDKLLPHLSGQLCQYIMARAKVMEFYEQMLAMSQNRVMIYEDLLIVVTEIVREHQKSFHHPILSPLKSTFNLECDVLTSLLQAQIHLQQWQFLPSLLQLHDAHNKLSSWGALVLTKEVKKLGFGSSSKPGPVQALYQWLLKFKGLLVAKFGLYFYDVLSKQAPSGEVKNLMSKTSVDFFGKIVTFQKKSDAANILLVFDVNGIEHSYKGPGYHHPQRVIEQPQGLDSYPAIFSYPGERPDKHWPSIISIMTSRVSDLNNWDKTIYFYDEKLQRTYFMSKVEQRITFVIIFESRKTEKDTYVNNFIMDVCSQLRCARLMSVLKPGGK